MTAPWPVRAQVPGLEVSWRRAWPDGARDLPAAERRVVLEGVVDDGDGRGIRVVAGRAVRGGVVALLPSDPALPALPALAARGARVTAHRAGKRAVLRTPDGAWLKVSSPKAARRALDRLAAVRALVDGRPGAPALVDARPETDGVLRLAHARGSDLTSLTATTDPATCRAAGLRVGEAMAAFAVPQRADVALPVHDAGAEAATLRTWVEDAVAHSVLPPALARHLQDRAALTAARLEGLAALPARLAHRDLHDGQVLLGERVTFLDVDTAAWADPALDAANLLAHLDLAVARPVSREVAHRAAALADGLRSGWAEHDHPAQADEERLTVLREATRLRLVAVHGFRTGPETLERLLRGGDAV